MTALALAWLAVAQAEGPPAPSAREDGVGAGEREARSGRPGAAREAGTGSAAPVGEAAPAPAGSAVVTTGEPPEVDVIVIADEPADASGDELPGSGPTRAPGDGDPTGALDDVLIIVDDDDEETAFTETGRDSADGGGEAPGEPEPGSTGSGGGRTFVKLELSSRLLIDTCFDDTRREPLERTGEDIVEWWNIGRLRVDHKQGRELGLVAEAWVRWGVAGEHPGQDRFALFNPRDTRWTGEVELREGYAQWRPGDVDIKVGQRIFVWGKNEVFAAADVLNPLDLRFDPIRVIDSPRDIKVPVFAVDLSYWWGDSGLHLVALPFFTPHRVTVLGRDFALAPPGSPLEAELAAVAQVHPSVSDQLQSSLWGTEVPEESPNNASLAARALTTIGGWDLALTAVYGWDRTPRLRIDPDLRLLAGAADAILADPEVLVTDPELRDAALGLQQKALVGEELIRARYKRMWLFAVEAQGVLGDLVVRTDVGASPERTFYSDTYVPLGRPALTGALGLEYSRGEEWYVAVTGYSLVVLDAPDEDLLLGIEAADAEPSGRDLAALIGVSGTVRWRSVDRGIQVSANGAFDIQPGDGFVNLDIAYDRLEPHRFRAGLVVLDGPAGTVGRRYGRNDLVYFGYDAAW